MKGERNSAKWSKPKKSEYRMSVLFAEGVIPSVHEQITFHFPTTFASW